MWHNHLSPLHEIHLSNYLLSSLALPAAWLERVVSKEILKMAHAIAPFKLTFTYYHIENEDLFRALKERENSTVNTRSAV